MTAAARARLPARPELSAFLARHRLIGEDGGRVLWERRFRHDTALLDGGAPGACFAKLCGPPTLNEELSLEGEARFHRWLGRSEAPAGLAVFVPPLLRQLEGGRLLVFRGYPDWTNLRTCIQQGDLDVATIPRLLGSFLGNLHQVGRDDTAAAFFPALSHPVGTYGHLTPEILANLAAGGIELVRLVQSEPCVNERLRELRAGWRATALIHGDMKLDNVLVAPHGSAISPDLRVLDWELCGWGHPPWDCGSLVGGYLFSWIEVLTPGSPLQSMRGGYARVLAAVRVFWEAYSEARQDDPAFEAAAHGPEMFAWAGYWLLQRAAASPGRRTLSAGDVSALHLALHLLTDTDGGLEEISELG